MKDEMTAKELVVAATLPIVLDFQEVPELITHHTLFSLCGTQLFTVG